METSCTAIYLKHVLIPDREPKLATANLVLGALQRCLSELPLPFEKPPCFESYFPWLVRFSHPDEAVQVSLALLEKLEASPLHIDGELVEIGIGIHECKLSVGEILESDCRRTQAIAGYSHAGQILLSAEARQALTATPEIRLQDRGEAKLGRFGSSSLFEVVRHTHSSGKLNTSPTAPSNLPQPPIDFVGRRQLRVGLGGLLTSPGVRILKGQGGIGKTSLALTTLHDFQLTGRVEGGTVVLDCEYLTALSQFLRNSAQILTGARLQAYSLLECRHTIRKRIEESHSVFLIENFEVIAKDPATRDPAVIEWIAEIGQHAAVLLTTQYALPGLDGDIIEVPPMTPEEASCLFQKRARSAGWETNESELEASPTDETVIGEICATVGALPLALELVASQASIFPLALLLKHLQHDQSLLESDADPTLPDRHRSVSAAISRGFQHLSQEALNLTYHLCVLPDGAGWELVSALTKQSREQWLPFANELVRSSIWRVEETSLGERYSQHKLIRGFVSERLDNRQWYFDNAIKVLAELASKKGKIAHPGSAPLMEMRAALDWLGFEWRNVISCGLEVLETRNSEAVFLFSEAIEPFFRLRGQLKDSKEFYEKALNLAVEKKDAAGQIRYYRYLGIVNRQLGLWNRAEDNFRQGYEISKREKDLLNELRALNNIGCARLASGDAQGAEEYLTRNLHMAPLRDDLERSIVLHNLGEAYLHQGKLEVALKTHRESLRISEAIGDQLGKILSWNAIGDVFRKQGNLKEAIYQYQQSAALQETIGDNASHAKPYIRLGDIYAGQSEWTLAMEMYDKCLRQRESSDDVLGTAITLKKIAEANASQGNVSLALQFADRAKRILAETEDRENLKDMEQSISKWQLAL